MSIKGKTIDQTGHSKTTKENSINNCEKMTRKYANIRMPNKLNDFVLKYGDQKYNEKAEEISSMTRELEVLEEDTKAENTSIYSTILKKVKLENARPR